MNKGIIGFFDILGYQSVLKNNFGDYAHKIAEKLANLEDELPILIRSFISDESVQKINHLLPKLRLLVFSDSLLQYSAYDGEDTIQDRCNRWQLHLLAAMVLWREMFHYGLPLRGAIHFGDFLVVKNCFAGCGIVEAYHQCQDLNLAACAYTRPALKEMLKDAEDATYGDLLLANIRGQVFNYLVPTHPPSPSQLAVVNPLGCRGKLWPDLTSGDIRQSIYEAFAKHKKDVPETVQPKLVNTEQYLRIAKYRIEAHADTPALRRIAGLETEE